MTPKGNHIGVILGVLVAAVVSFIVASLILKTSKAGEEDLTAAAEKMQQMKGKKSQAVSALTSADEAENSQRALYEKCSQVARSSSRVMPEWASARWGHQF